MMFVKFMLDFTANIGEAAKEQLQSEPSSDTSHSVYSTPNIRFNEQVFCLSGDFDCFESKGEVEKCKVWSTMTSHPYFTYAGAWSG